MPTRSRSHVLETDSRRAFARLLPPEWVIRPLDSEYGIDDQVEVFEKQGPTTGLMFFVQMKATDQGKLGTALKLRFKVDTLDYYRSLELPVMIVRFHAQTRKFYWQWFHEFEKYPKARQKTLTLSLPISAEWNDESPAQIKASLQTIRQLKSTACPHPIVFTLVLHDAEVCGMPSSVLRAILMEMAGPLRGVLKLTETAPVGAHPEIVISRDKLVVDLARLRSITIDFKEGYKSDVAQNRLPHDVFIGVAFVLATSGHSSEASEIASGHLAHGSLIASPEVLSALIRAMAKSRRVSDALQLARSILSQAGAPQLPEWLLLFAVGNRETLQKSEVEFLGEVMEMLMERAKELGDRQNMAVAHYNLGNHLRSRGGPHRKAAFRHYRLAAKAEPGYRQRQYFWKEIGGLLHLLGHFRWSADAYRKAVQLGGDNMCLALYADSLMRSGKFQDALNAFRQYMEKEVKPDAEWLLKDFVLSHLVEDLGIAEQQPCSHWPNKLTDPSGISEEEAHNRLLLAIRSDALSSFAWFNLGASFGQLGAKVDAFKAYLFAAICLPHDVEAWGRALLYGISSLRAEPLNASLAVCIARMAYRRNGQTFLAELGKLVDRQEPGFPRTELMNLVGDAVKDIDRLNRLTEVRMVGEGPNYEVILRAEKPG